MWMDSDTNRLWNDVADKVCVHSDNKWLNGSYSTGVTISDFDNGDLIETLAVNC